LVLTTQRCNFPQWLVDKANCMFVGVNDTYINFVDNRVLFAIESNIHHVESWGSFAKNAEAALKRVCLWREDIEDEADYRCKTIQWGENASLGRALP